MLMYIMLCTNVWNPSKKGKGGMHCINRHITSWDMLRQSCLILHMQSFHSNSDCVIVTGYITVESWAKEQTVVSWMTVYSRCSIMNALMHSGRDLSHTAPPVCWRDQVSKQCCVGVRGPAMESVPCDLIPGTIRIMHSDSITCSTGHS